MMLDRASRRDGAVALLLAVACVALYSATCLGRIYGNDGAMLADWGEMPEHSYQAYHNALFLPIVHELATVLPAGILLPADDPLAAVKALSVLCGGIGIAFTYLCCRRFGVTALASVAGTLLLAVSPVLWFFSSTIEVHALHFAVCAACAWVTLAAPWRRPVLATLLTASVFWLTYVSHRSAPILGPGWVLLVQCARTQRGQPFRLGALFVIGVVLLASLLFGNLFSNWLRGVGFTLHLEFLVSTVTLWHRAFTPEILWSAVLGPLLMLVPVGVVALTMRSIDGWLRLCALTLMVPIVGYVVWWGIPEQGGYVLGQSWVLAVLAGAVAARLRGRTALLAAGAVLAVQAAAGFWQVHSFNAEGFQIGDRAARVHEYLGTEGLLLSANDNAPDIHLYLPGIVELHVLPTLVTDAPIDGWFAGFYPFLQLCTKGKKFLFDVSYHRRDDYPDIAQTAATRLEAAIRTDYRVTELDDASWPMWLVEPR